MLCVLLVRFAPHMDQMLLLARGSGKPACAPSVGCGRRATLQQSAVVPGGSASHELADGLDLPNASRTNKTFRSGLARGARRQASAEMLRLWVVWAVGSPFRTLPP